MTDGSRMLVSGGVERSSADDIHAFGTVFRTIKARDREVIIDDNGLINYTSLMESITGKRQAFKSICQNNRGLYRHVLYHDKEKLEAWAKEEMMKTEKSKVRLNSRTSQIAEFLSSIKTIETRTLFFIDFTGLF